MKIQEASQRSQLSIDTIRFYEKAGMLPRIPRDNSGWRNFDADALDWLVTLERLRSTGMPLKEVRRFAVLVHEGNSAGPGASAERLNILQRHSVRLAKCREELDACEAYLTRKITIYSKMKG
jgi:MerR family transcriptional regulator, aldehyde-responsive regulator